MHFLNPLAMSEFVHVVYNMSSEEGEIDVWLVREPEFTGLFAQKKNGEAWLTNGDGTFHWDESGKLACCWPTSPSILEQIQHFSETPFANQKSAKERVDNEETSSIFPPLLKDSDVHHHHLEKRVPSPPSVSECIEAILRTHSVPEPNATSMTNETLSTFHDKVTESRQLIVVDEVIFHGPNAVLQGATALRLTSDFQTVLSDAVPISDLKTSTQCRHGVTDRDINLGELWGLAKAAYDNAFWWANTSPPSGFVLVEVFVRKSAAAKLYRKDDIFYISFAGTYPFDIRDYLYDLDWTDDSINGETVPRGFKRYVEKIAPLIEASPYFDDISVLIGHSLGGAAAVLFSKKHPEKDWIVVTFGAPKTTKPNSCGQRGIRICAAEDSVCSNATGLDFLLPKVAGFKHDVQNAKVITAKSACQSHQMCSFLEWQTCCPWAVSNVYEVRDAESCDAVSQACETALNCAINLIDHAYIYERLLDIQANWRASSPDSTSCPAAADGVCHSISSVCSLA